MSDKQKVGLCFLLAFIIFIVGIPLAFTGGLWTVDRLGLVEVDWGTWFERTPRSEVSQEFTVQSDGCCSSTEVVNTYIQPTQSDSCCN